MFVSFTICALVASEPFVTFRSSLRKGEPSWSVTLTWSRPLSLTSLRVLISYFLCLCVSVFMYVCFSRCYFHETTKGRRRWVLILKRNISCFCCFWIQSNLPTPADVPLKGIQIPDPEIQESFACEIWNPGLWNPENSSRNLDPTNDWIQESKFQW